MREELKNKLINLLNNLDFYFIDYKGEKYLPLNHLLFKTLNLMTVKTNLNYVNEVCKKIFEVKYGAKQVYLIRYNKTKRSWFLNIDYIVDYFLFIVLKAKKGKRFNELPRELVNIFLEERYMLNLYVYYLDETKKCHKNYPILFVPDFYPNGINLLELRELKDTAVKYLRKQYFRYLSDYTKIDTNYVKRLLGGRFGDYIINRILVFHF